MQNNLVLPIVCTAPELTAREHRLYLYAYHRPGKTVKEIARALNFSKETTRRTVNRLIETEWIYTYIEPGRSRGRRIIPGMPLAVERQLASLLVQRRTSVTYFGEWLMRSMVDWSVKDYVYQFNAHPPWLITATGTRLQVDCLFESANVALEFQGPQHFQKGDQFVRTDEELSRRMHFDGEKMRLCTLHEVKLIELRARDLEYHRFRRKLGKALPLIPRRESGPVYRELVGMANQYIKYMNDVESS